MTTTEPECAVTWEKWHFYKGPAQWHHPISRDGMVGVYLCQGHHSLVCGRKKRYGSETEINESNYERALKINQLVIKKIQEKGYGKGDIDKN